MTQQFQKMPWVVVGPAGVYWLGHAHNEQGAWTDALGWPDDEEVSEHKRLGWYAAEATVTWQRPAGVKGTVNDQGGGDAPTA